MEQNFGLSNVSETIEKINDNLRIILGEMEIFLTLPIDYIKKGMSQADFIKYIELREKTIHLLELLEVFVYDTNDDAQTCFECGETIPQIIHINMNGELCDTLNGTVEHWVTKGKIHHIFICDKCLDKRNK